MTSPQTMAERAARVADPIAGAIRETAREMLALAENAVAARYMLNADTMTANGRWAIEAQGGETLAIDTLVTLHACYVTWGSDPLENAVLWGGNEYGRAARDRARHLLTVKLARVRRRQELHEAYGRTETAATRASDFAREANEARKSGRATEADYAAAVAAEDDAWAAYEAAEQVLVRFEAGGETEAAQPDAA